jgi:hypothetical protein
MTTTPMTNELLETLINVNKYDNNPDRAAANVWEDINNYTDGKGGFFQVKTHLATLLTAFDRQFTAAQMDKVFPYGNQILDAFGWTIDELFEHDIYNVTFENVDEDNLCLVQDRLNELAGVVDGDLQKTENLVAVNFAYALRNVLALWNEELPQLATAANVFVKLAEHLWA